MAELQEEEGAWARSHTARGSNPSPAFTRCVTFPSLSPRGGGGENTSYFVRIPMVNPPPKNFLPHHSLKTTLQCPEALTCSCSPSSWETKAGRW